jgi:type I restriction-modification system DNA methylase subunit
MKKRGLELNMATIFTPKQLESHLWEAANILRGPVDAADFKSYVFPLLFFKRLSDVHDEEYRIAMKESGGDEEYAQFPQNYRFQVPGVCHWRRPDRDDQRRSGSAEGYARHRKGKSGNTIWHLWRCPMEQ